VPPTRYWHRSSGACGNRPRNSQVLVAIRIPSSQSSNTVGAPRPVGDVKRFCTSAGHDVVGAGGVVGTRPVATMTLGKVTGPFA
jgi:hypothetical protein